MHHLTLTAFVALFLFVSCGPDEPVEPPPANEYLVVGNDRGFRDDFINQANHVTVTDSALRVRSLRSADSYRDYPIVDSFLQGGTNPALHWKYGAIGNDTITLTDTSRNCTFYLHRLSRVDSLPNAVGMLTSGEINSGTKLGAFSASDNLLFKDLGQSAGCMVNRRYYPYQDWSTMTGNSNVRAMPEVEFYVRQTPPASLWRIYERFAQPILVVDNYEKGMTVVMLDSLAERNDTLYGRSISDRSFNRIGSYKLVRTDSAAGALNEEQLKSITGLPVRVELSPEKARKQYRHRWQKRDDRSQFLTVNEQEIDELSLVFLEGDNVSIRSGNNIVAQSNYRFHETAPYLIIGDDCDSYAHWHYAISNDSLTVRVPLRINLEVNEQPQTFKDGKGNIIEVPVSEWYFEEEWRAVYIVLGK